MNNALKVSNLQKNYKDFTLGSISIDLPEGHIMGFVGQNGAGKTTTIRLILNMMQRDAGEIKIFGLDNINDEQKIKQDVGVVFDDVYFADGWKVSEVEQAIKGFYSNWSSKLYRHYADSFKLPMGKRVKELSRGMKMKLMLAAAMSHEAKLLILDEPTSGLDPVARDELLDILGEYISDGRKSILFSTHITSDLEKIADYITLIDRGKIFYSGAKDDLLESYYIVKGGTTDLTEPLRKKIVGLSKTGAGFTGLFRTSDSEYLPQEIGTEHPSIDDILIYISREGTSHE
jgi:ABC-2 type transport system ATP-binding protein